MLEMNINKWLVNNNTVINDNDIIDFVYNAWYNIDQKKRKSYRKII